MKVLFVQKISGISGSERYFINIIPKLQKQGVDVAFLMLYSDEKLTIEFAKIMQSYGVKNEQIRIARWSIFTAIFQIAKIIRKGGFDLVHSHLIHADVLLALTKFIRTKFTLISTKHGFDEVFIKKYGLKPDKRLYNAYFFAAIFAEKFIDSSFTVSHGLSKLYFSLGITNYYPQVIWHGIAVPESKKSVEQTSGEQPYILVLGRLETFKGHKLLFDAFEKIAEGFPKVRIRVVGGGSAQVEFEDYARKIGIAEQVDFLGYRTDVDHQIEHCLFLVSPSKGEGFGLIIIEAFAFSKPVITFDVPAFNEIIAHNVDGILVPAFDIDLLSDALKKMLTNPELAASMGANGLSKLKGTFSLSKCIEDTVKFYNEHSVTEKPFSDEKKKEAIAIFTISLHGGGAEKVAFYAALELAKDYQVNIVLLNPNVQFKVPNEIKVYKLSKFEFENALMKILTLPFLSLRLAFMMRRLKVKKVISFLNRPNYINVIAHLFFKQIKTIISERTYTDLEFPNKGWQNITSRLLIKLLYPKADLVIANSKTTSHSLVNKFGVDAKKIKTVYNSIISDNYENQNAQKSSGVLKLVSIGRLDSNKNVGMLIDVLSIVEFDFELIIVGDGPLKKQLDEKIKFYNLQDKITLLGFVNDVIPFLHQSDVMILCSRHEGYPNVVLEAVFSQIEVVVSDCFSGPREILSDNENSAAILTEGWEKLDLGYLFAVDDKKALLEILNEINQERRSINVLERTRLLANRHQSKNAIENLKSNL